MAGSGKMIKIGPSEHIYGRAWDEVGKSELVQILITHGTLINSIQFVYTENGEILRSDIRGGKPNSRNFNMVTLDYPSEFLTWVSGSYGGSFGSKYVASVTFGTNKGKYGPFGGKEDPERQFNYQIGPHRSFGGFHGSTCDSILETIGIYIKPITKLSDVNKPSVQVKEEKSFD